MPPRKDGDQWRIRPRSSDHDRGAASARNRRPRTSSALRIVPCGGWAKSPRSEPGRSRSTAIQLQAEKTSHRRTLGQGALHNYHRPRILYFADPPAPDGPTAGYIEEACGSVGVVAQLSMGLMQLVSRHQKKSPTTDAVAPMSAATANAGTRKGAGFAQRQATPVSPLGEWIWEQVQVNPGFTFKELARRGQMSRCQ